MRRAWRTLHLRSLPAPLDGNADERLSLAADLPAALMAWAQDTQLNRQYGTFVPFTQQAAGATVWRMACLAHRSGRGHIRSEY
jgi:hypothetical protein